MNLCWLIPDDRGGGIASVAISCVRQARANGHDAVLLLLLEPTGWLAGEAGIRIASLGLRKSGPEATGAILQWLAKNPQEIVILNGCEEADAVIAFLPATVRCVYVVHDTAPRFWQAAVAAERDLDGIVAVSDTVAGKFKQRLKVTAKLRVILNGCLFPPPSRLSAPRPDDLLFLGGGNPTKGAHDVLRLWPRLMEVGFAGRLQWFGAIDSALEDQILALSGAAERIRRPGRVPREAVFEAAASSKVLLMLSRVEPFGMATIEAMSMGCVPIAWNIETGTKEIVGGDTGFFAPLGDSRALAMLVERVCAEHARLSPFVVRRARENFSEEVMWRGYAALLGEIVQQPPLARLHAGQTPPKFAPPRRSLQFMPTSARRLARDLIGRSPRLGYWLRDFRGR